MSRKTAVVILLFFLPLWLQAQKKKGTVTLNGTVTNATGGEQLEGATLFFVELKTGTSTDEYGRFSVTIPKGNYRVRFSYLGYKTQTLSLLLEKDSTVNIALQPAEQNLKEVEIKGESARDNVQSVQMSVNKITAKELKTIPAFMGEVDLVKALQLLPGVKFVAEGSTGFSVRGGSPDQNLVLLDEATIYNAGHLMGFFSVFNSDAVKDVKLYKGDLPPAFGGRIASLVDVRMKEGNNKAFHGKGGAGLISSRLLLEGPMVKNRASFLVSGRRTYADLFLKLSKDEKINRNRLYFYDLNLKMNYIVNNNNRLYLSGYFGKDVFKNEFFKMNWGNAVATLRWNHLFSKKLFSNFTFVANRFNYNLGIPETNPRAFLWKSSLTDYTLKGDFTLSVNGNNRIKWGFSSVYHNFYPGVIKGTGSESFIGEYALQSQYALESALYAGNEQKIGTLLTLNYGLRLSLFNNVGPATVYRYDAEHNLADSTVYTGSTFYNTYAGLEPRLGLVYRLSENSSVKASYSGGFQYLQQAQNATAGNPLDIWFPSSPNIKPQKGDQIAFGYFRNFRKNRFESSVEVYYKRIRNAVDFKDHADLLLNKYLEGELRTGKGIGYGVEFYLKKNTGKLTGWLSYTFSRAFRVIEGINNGDPYPATYDRPHDVSVVLNYRFTPQISAGAAWVYLTGQPVTFPVGKMQIDNATIPVYSGRNQYRLPDYHRLDISFTWTEKQKPHKRWHSEVNVSVYNAYYRKNPWIINFVTDSEDPNVTHAEMTYLLGIVPAVTYNFRF